MALNVTVNTTRTRIRQEADIETTDEANSICPDAMLDAWINDAYRDLYDVLCEEVAQERFGTTATINHTTNAVPSDFYRLLGLDYTPTGTTLSPKPFVFGERNRLKFMLEPSYRLDKGVILWEPPEQTPTSDYTMWYVPTPATLAAGGSFDSINGWDTYIILWVKLKVRAKQEYDLGDTLTEFAMCKQRVRNSAARVAAYAETVEDSRAAGDDWYFNG